MKFLTDHLEGIITTSIGVVSSIFFYYLGKRDNTRSAKESNRKLLTLEKQGADNLNFSGKINDWAVRLNDKISIKMEEGLSEEDVSIQFFAYLDNKELDQADKYLTDKIYFIKSRGYVSYLRARLLVARKKHSEAVALLDAALPQLKKHKKAHEFYWFKSWINHDYLNNYKQAIADLEVANELQPSADYMSMLSDVYREVNQHAKAWDIARSAILKDGKNPRALNCMARRCYEQKKYQEGLTYVEQGLLANCLSSYLYVTKGLLLGALSDYVGAKEAYNDAISIDSDYFPALYELADRLISEGDFHQAGILMNKVRLLAPHNMSTLTNYFVCLIHEGKYLEVVETADKFNLVQNVKQYPEAVNNLALAAASCGQYQKAETCLMELLIAYPEALGTYIQLASIYLSNECRDLKKAAYYADKVLRQDKRSKNGLLLKGSIAMLKNDFDASLAFYKRALAIDPESSHVKESIICLNRYKTLYFTCISNGEPFCPNIILESPVEFDPNTIFNNVRLIKS